jgi:hypothetical protein
MHASFLPINTNNNWVEKRKLYMVDIGNEIGGIKSNQEVPVYGMVSSGNIQGVGTVNNTENTKFDKVSSIADGGSNQQNDVQRLFDPHGIFISV